MVVANHFIQYGLHDFAFCLFQLACVRDIILSKNLVLFVRLQLVKLNIWAAWRCCFSFV